MEEKQVTQGGESSVAGRRSKCHREEKQVRDVLKDT
jgi:hypothetical protein